MNQCGGAKDTCIIPDKQVHPRGTRLMQKPTLTDTCRVPNPTTCRGQSLGMEPDLEDRPLSAGLLTSRLGILACKMGERHHHRIYVILHSV